MRFSVLTLSFEIVDNRPDWPVLSISVDGKNPFAQVAKEWRGFDPGEILGTGTPLVPDDAGHRVAVYRCSCGEAGCGVIAPYVVPSPDHTRISWVDFRDYTGVFMRPLSPSAANHEGLPWELPDIDFDREQYLAEVRRITNDRSWETPRRQTARLLEELLRSMELVPHLQWVSPDWRGDGTTLSFEHHNRQQLLRLNSTETDPTRAANDMAQQLLSTALETWPANFPYDH